MKAEEKIKAVSDYIANASGSEHFYRLSFGRRLLCTDARPEVQS